ncbi:acetate/propionate family kinase [Mucilaginibacter sp. P25]|uniref:Acetate kinase n=1 Tax=Mucilaginibacter gossypii TaxID=551996 RepID=A0A1G7U2E6_9SPHI|nr:MULTISPECIES: acetate/propionate family kinase [Mucilaginibacter]QTE38862.1 acetate/propionate family kinase [Mucilaginibacter gossypii]RAV55065.1 acetate/propionate family kinase [Mucilaginibacter rubeus]SDG41762.1 acetate kinase [Mucilaginibacter gossypii]
MNPDNSKSAALLVFNAGSSSIKFSFFRLSTGIQKVGEGRITRIGLPGTSFILTRQQFTEIETIPGDVTDFISVIKFLANWIECQPMFSQVKIIAHRVVHGIEDSSPAPVTENLLNELKQAAGDNPEHLPNEIKLIEIFRHRHPQLQQYVCFDSYFHQNMAPVAKLLPLPDRFRATGLRRFGFHGLSYQYIMQKLNSEGKGYGKTIIAHLGNGASLAAVNGGNCIDTTMGFTPGSGLPMSTRYGDIDPGVAWYLMKKEGLSADQFIQIMNHESGLLGVSGSSGDMQDLLLRDATDFKAVEAINLFCYYIKKAIGAFTAALGGVDTLVFTGGIGENAPVIRERICTGLDFLGLKLNAEANTNQNKNISANDSRVNVYIIPTDEELMMAQIVNEIIHI